MDNYALEVNNLNISYKNLKAFSIKQSLLKFKKTEKEEIHAVKNVSFSVPKGEILGIIGKNGSGKSTLLKSLAGIFCPDSGSIDLKNNSISLMAIGVGFQKKLSGRENILLSGMLLGFSEEEIREKMSEIIDFAGLGKFIDMPVKTYSSGMHSKLAFSITAILETNIMLVDEVLSVGDTKFRKKSLAKMKSLIDNKDRTVIIVSHSNQTLLELCDKVMWMHEGEVKMIDSPPTVIKQYENFMHGADQKK